jgi:hypothetical protein
MSQTEKFIYAIALILLRDQNRVLLIMRVKSKVIISPAYNIRFTDDYHPMLIIHILSSANAAFSFLNSKYKSF